MKKKSVECEKIMQKFINFLMISLLKVDFIGISWKNLIFNFFPTEQINEYLFKKMSK